MGICSLVTAIGVPFIHSHFSHCSVPPLRFLQLRAPLTMGAVHATRLAGKLEGESQKRGGLPNPALHSEEKSANPIKINGMGRRQLWGTRSWHGGATCSCCWMLQCAGSPLLTIVQNSPCWWGKRGVTETRQVSEDCNETKWKLIRKEILSCWACSNSVKLESKGSCCNPEMMPWASELPGSSSSPASPGIFMWAAVWWGSTSACACPSVLLSLEPVSWEINHRSVLR